MIHRKTLYAESYWDILFVCTQIPNVLCLFLQKNEIFSEFFFVSTLCRFAISAVRILFPNCRFYFYVTNKHSKYKYITNETFQIPSNGFSRSEII